MLRKLHNKQERKFEVYAIRFRFKMTLKNLSTPNTINQVVINNIAKINDDWELLSKSTTTFTTTSCYTHV
jgi:hypothetical protein